MHRIKRWTAEDITMKKLCVLAVILLCFEVNARPQTELKWNWEEVILSRNGPSTTTTPRPTSWSTTTLRFLDIAQVSGAGSGSVEDAYLVPRRRSRRPQTSKGATFNVSSMLICALVALVLKT